jgi:antitoxin VapB
MMADLSGASQWRTRSVAADQERRLRPRRIDSPRSEPCTAKVFMTNRSQAVRLPKEYQFSTDEVFIRKQGDDVILSPRPRDWSAYLKSAPAASDAFMNGVEDLPVQEREC